MVYQITQGTFTPVNFIKSTLLVQKDEPKVLLAATGTVALDIQNAVDKQVVETTTYTPEQCAEITYTDEELKENMKTAVVTNEDVGRYVGYGRKDISKGNGLNLGYGLLRLFYPKNDVCYGINGQAKLLCKNAQAIENFNIPELQKMFAQLKTGSEAYELVSGALAAYEAKASSSVINPAEYRDQILAIKQYYQNHAIKTEAGKINIPYRYLTPFNVVFNRSLQNLSSYYTDIGYVWLIILGMLVLGFVYALCNAKRFKQDTNLVVIS